MKILCHFICGGFSRICRVRFPYQNIMSFSSHFLFFVLVDKSYKKQKYYVIVFCFVFNYSSFLYCCLALQTENIVQKITQSIFVFGNFVVNQIKKRKMDDKLIREKLAFVSFFFAVWNSVYCCT